MASVRSARTRWGLTCLMLAAAVMAACTAGPAVVPQAPVSGPEAAPQVSGPPLLLRVMTYNVLGGPVLPSGSR